jgi:hypothetical protein
MRRRRALCSNFRRGARKPDVELEGRQSDYHAAGAKNVRVCVAEERSIAFRDKTQRVRSDCACLHEEALADDPKQKSAVVGFRGNRIQVHQATLWVRFVGGLSKSVLGPPADMPTLPTGICLRGKDRTWRSNRQLRQLTTPGNFRTQPAAPAFENCWHAQIPCLLNIKHLTRRIFSALRS